MLSLTLDDIDFKWMIGQLSTIKELNGLNDVIFAVDLTLVGSYSHTDGNGYFEAFHMPVDLLDQYTPPDADNFTPLANITEEQMLSWLLPKISETRINEAKKVIKSRIEDQSNYKVVTPPWVKSIHVTEVPPGEEIVFEIPPKS